MQELRMKWIPRDSEGRKILTESAHVVSHEIYGFINDFGGDKLYAFWYADCFDPPKYLVLGDSFTDAYDNFLELKGKPLDEADLADLANDNPGLHPEECGGVQYRDSGDYVWTEDVMGVLLAGEPD